MQRDRRDQHPARDEAGDECLGERPSGARHLGAPGLGGVDVLVVRQAASADRRTRSGSVRRGPRRYASTVRPAEPLELREHQSTPGSIRECRRHPSTAGEHQLLSVDAVRRMRALGAADLDNAPVRTERRSPRGYVQAGRGSVSPTRAERRRQRRRDVHDEQIAGLEDPCQVGERRVGDRLLRARGDHQPDAVPRRAPRLLRGRSLETRRQLERERVHAGTSTSRAR